MWLLFSIASVFSVTTQVVQGDFNNSDGLEVDTDHGVLNADEAEKVKGLVTKKIKDAVHRFRNITWLLRHGHIDGEPGYTR